MRNDNNVKRNTILKCVVYVGICVMDVAYSSIAKYVIKYTEGPSYNNGFTFGLSLNLVQIEEIIDIIKKKKNSSYYLNKKKPSY